MARLKDTVATDSFVRDGEKMLDIEHGGQHGWSPRLGKIDTDGIKYENWISNQAHVRRNVVAIVLKTPRFFEYMPDKEKLQKMMKALIELHAESIEGLTSGLTVEFGEHAVGGGGEQQEEFIDVKRARSTITTTFTEKAGRPIQKFLDLYIRYGIMDPDTKTPLVATLDGFESDVYTNDYAGATVLFFEPDVTNTNIVSAWLSSNFMPKSNGEKIGGKDKTAAGEIIKHSIGWTSITTDNKEVEVLAKTFLDRLNNVAVIPNEMPLFVDDIIADINDENAANGYVGTASGKN